MGGFVAADILYEYAWKFAANQAAACESQALYQASLDAQEYNLGFGFLADVATLAETAPDDPSPIVPGLTNLQTALFIVSVPDGTNFGTPWYHFFAPVIQDGLPVDLAYTQTPAMLDFLQNFVAFEPVTFARDYAAVWCDEDDVPWDDFLSDIEVPILSLGTGGGLGAAAVHTLDLVGSTDKTVVTVSLDPESALDFGHIDLWTADDAPHLAWAPLLAWIEDHPQRPGRHEAVADQTPTRR